jgi:hypothetical protein
LAIGHGTAGAAAAGRPVLIRAALLVPALASVEASARVVAEGGLALAGEASAMSGAAVSATAA